MTSPKIIFQPQVYDRSWIDVQRRQLGNCDPILLEKSIYALTLLGHLSQSELPFLFKGGTSLMLHLPDIRRLSIDIDIVSPSDDAELDRVVAEIGQTKPFYRQSEDDRGVRNLPQRRHFKFFFPSSLNQRHESYVLLDVVREEKIVHACTRRPIQTSFLTPEEEVLVELPTIESLLGDKLTAFAPTTIGVPLRKPDGVAGEVMQVAKQLFDVGILFEHATDFAEVSKTYDAVQAQEASYRGRKIPRDVSLDDTFKSCLGIVAHKGKIRQNYPDADLLLSGFSKLKGHLNWPKFSDNDQRTLAARTACLAQMLKNGMPAAPAAIRYTGNTDQIALLQTASLQGHEFSWIDGIRGINAEAYHYLYTALKDTL
jgi:hypothetical protein